MYFTPATPPSLTPLGVRLLSLSERKLASLDLAVGARDSADLLRRGVLVRESVRSAWASLTTGPSDMTNWRAPTALGLDTLTEEDEDAYDQEIAEEQWLDNVISSFHDEADEDAGIAWVETTVSLPSDDDIEYDGSQAYDLSGPRFASAPAPATVRVTRPESAPAIRHASAAATSVADSWTVQVSAIDDMYDDEYEYSNMDSGSASWLELDPEEPFDLKSMDSVTVDTVGIDYDEDSEDEFAADEEEVVFDPLDPAVPPPMQRSLSSSSTSSLSDEDDETCRTPPWSPVIAPCGCEDLEELAEPIPPLPPPRTNNKDVEPLRIVWHHEEEVHTCT